MWGQENWGRGREEGKEGGRGGREGGRGGRERGREEGGEGRREGGRGGREEGKGGKEGGRERGKGEAKKASPAVSGVVVSITVTSRSKVMLGSRDTTKFTSSLPFSGLSASDTSLSPSRARKIPTSVGEGGEGEREGGREGGSTFMQPTLFSVQPIHESVWLCLK